jgi:hypothetical protein
MHINSWARVLKGRGKTPPIAEVEDVVQAKLMEEHTRHVRKLKLKVRGLLAPSPSLDPLQVVVSFLGDTLNLANIGL